MFSDAVSAVQSADPLELLVWKCRIFKINCWELMRNLPADTLGWMRGRTAALQLKCSGLEALGGWRWSPQLGFPDWLVLCGKEDSFWNAEALWGALVGKPEDEEGQYPQEGGWLQFAFVTPEGGISPWYWTLVLAAALWRSFVAVSYGKQFRSQ